MTEPIGLTAVPAPLRWWNTPVDHAVEGPDRVTVTAGPRTDVFADPGGPNRTATAPALLAALDGRPRVGFLAQSPVGAGRTVRFSEVTHTRTVPEDLRGGG